jgi:hypothetical protein
MAKPPVVESRDLDHAVRVARVTGSQGVRNAALLYTLFGTGLMPSELAALRVADVVSSQGEIRRKSLVRGEIAYNGYERTLYWSNSKVRNAIEDYLAWRIEHQVGMGTPGRFRGLDPHSFLFINGRSGEGFPATGYRKDGGTQRKRIGPLCPDSAAFAAGRRCGLRQVGAPRHGRLSRTQRGGPRAGPGDAGPAVRHGNENAHGPGSGPNGRHHGEGVQIPCASILENLPRCEMLVPSDIAKHSIEEHMAQEALRLAACAHSGS